MTILSETIRFTTSGAGDLLDITGRVAELVAQSKLQTGNVTVFAVGSTGAITTLEYEPGLVKDMRETYEKLAPSGRSYHHDATWGDSNGFSHVRASLQGPSLTIPFDGGKLVLGTWQQVVFAEFDNRPRDRRVVVQIIGE